MDSDDVRVTSWRTLVLLTVGVLLVIPMRSRGGSQRDETLAPIDVDPRATLAIWYPGEHRLSPTQQGPSIRPPVAVVEGERVAIERLPDGRCPRVRTLLQTYPEEPAGWIEDDGKHVWSAGIFSQMSEWVDAERCEVVIHEAKSQIRWRRVPIRRPDARTTAELEAMGLKIPIDPARNVEAGR